MKHLYLVLSLSLVAFVATFTTASADTYDSATATVQKGGAHTAKVMVEKHTYMAPIMFDDGASWTCVKDHYEVAPAVVSGLEAGKIAISVDADGKASFHFKKKK